MNLPVQILRDLEVILILKSKYEMALTEEETKILDHFKALDANQRLSAQKAQLEKLFHKDSK